MRPPEEGRFNIVGPQKTVTKLQQNIRCVRIYIASIVYLYTLYYKATKKKKWDKNKKEKVDPDVSKTKNLKKKKLKASKSINKINTI